MTDAPDTALLRAMTESAALRAAWARRDVHHRLGPHFTLGELCWSRDGIGAGLDNWPGSFDAVADLQRLVDQVLEPLRVMLGRPVTVNSGYRAPDVNRLVGGQVNSAHLTGRAADVEVPGMANLVLARLVRDTKGLPFDQVILENHHVGDPPSGWVHVQIAPAGVAPRRASLTIAGGRTLSGLQALA